MTDPKNITRLRNVRALLYLLLVLLFLQWLTSSFIEYLNITGKMDRVLQSPAGAAYMIPAMRSLFESTCITMSLSLVIIFALLFFIRRIGKSLAAGSGG